MKRKKVELFVRHPGNTNAVWETAEAFCEGCVYWKRHVIGGGGHVSSKGDCHRYPKVQMKSETDWCGEFVPEGDE